MNDRSALTQEVKLREDNSDVIEIFLFSDCVVLEIATEIFCLRLNVNVIT